MMSGIILSSSFNKMEIKNYIDKIYNEVLNLRRKIHINPELSNFEKETTETLNSFFVKKNIYFHKFKNIYGGYVFINNNKSQSIAYRADIDALPIQENSGFEFVSKNQGVMHACGHDIHTAIACGIALCSNKFKDSLNYNILVIFQPAEENNPKGGAEDVIKEGIFKKYNISEVYGLHCWPGYNLGDVLVKKNVQQAASNKFSILVRGKNSHAAEPDKGIDAIEISTQVVDYALNKLRRELSPHETCVLSIGSIQSKGTYNIISDEVEIEGTIRTTSKYSLDLIKSRLSDYIERINVFYKTKSEVTVHNGYDMVINNDSLFKSFIEYQNDKNKEINIIDDFDTSLIAEDFSAYRSVANSLFMFLGCGTNIPLHSDRFLPDENTIKLGINLMGSYLVNR